MLSKISILLTNHQLTLKDISQKNDLREQDLENAFHENPNNWSSSVLSALSSSLNMRPGDLLELLDPVYSLKINDSNQMIQGIYIEDPEIYEQVRFVIESEHLEGWQPDEEDVLRLLDEAINPSNELQTEINQIWGEEDE
ncbi:helix-turn-helix domain-containing protein [Lactobacillus taiwanensis]|uniref:helix-turn-helix domain-containing protein n=1 Tax=Lactobacillus taiwanensis TaxID=508451 RepID=UPI001AEC0C2D|nr:helix-turn-helix domain-containing protein [Lactobacillus taiwanensis]QTQ40509.1 helix-turn-helix domain-containing protein [Lactobacillus taiwanensis]